MLDHLKDQRTVAIALMNIGHKRFLEIGRKYNKMQKELDCLSKYVASISKRAHDLTVSRGAIYDGLVEAQFYLNFTTEVTQEGRRQSDMYCLPKL